MILPSHCLQQHKSTYDPMPVFSRWKLMMNMLIALLDFVEISMAIQTSLMKVYIHFILIHFICNMQELECNH